MSYQVWLLKPESLVHPLQDVSFATQNKILPTVQMKVFFLFSGCHRQSPSMYQFYEADLRLYSKSLSQPAFFKLGLDWICINI